MYSKPSSIPASAATDRPATGAAGYWQGVGRRLARQKPTLALAVVLGVVIASAILAPLIAPFEPNQTRLQLRLQGIGTAGHWLGTDELGRDVLSRIVHGGRVSLFMGIVPIVIATTIGGALGLVAGLSGGRINTLIMRVTDMVYAFPSLLLAVALSGVIGPGIGNCLLSLSIVFIPSMCRVAETAASQLRHAGFVEAARLTGAGPVRILLDHVLGNALAPIVVYAAGLVSVSILLAAGLSFLGLGVEPPTPDWGAMLASMRQSVYVNPYVCALPGAAIFITSLSFAVISDGLRKAMEVR